MNSQGELFFKGKLLGKRNKISRACDECRKRKVKCDGVQPCSRCRKSNAECVFAKLPPKRGPPKQYMENLENRLQRVEKALSLLSPTPKLDPMLDSSSHNMTQSQHRFAINEIGQAYYVNDIQSRVDRIPSSDTTMDTHSDKASVCDSSSSSTASLFHHLPPTIITTQAETAIPDHLSSRNILSEVQPLTDIYFDHVHKYVPMIHKPSFLKQMHSATNPPSRLLLYAMCAVASRWSPDYLNHNHQSANAYPNQGGLPGYTYYQRALDLLDEFTDSPRITTIQALVLLVKYQEYFQRPGYHHRSYLYLGIAVKMCDDLGLSQIEGDAYETETKRRTFWVTFMYDLLLSIEQGHASYFDTRQCKTGFPLVTGEEGPALEELIINQNIFIQLAKVLSEIYAMSRRIATRQQLQGDKRTKDQEIEEQARLFSLHTHLENFLFEVPPSLIYPPTQDNENYLPEKQPITDPFIGFLHMTYHFSMILLHRPYVYASNTELYQHRKLCAASASHITWITETMIEQYPSFTFSYPTRGIQHTIHCLTLAATIHKHEWIHAEQESTKQVAHQQYMLTVDMIQKLGRYSPCSELFEKVDPMYSLMPTRSEMVFNIEGYPAWPQQQQQQQMEYMAYSEESRRQPIVDDYDMDKQYMVYDPSSGMSQLFLGEDLWENKTVRSEGHVMK
ncbi:hypothetical protein K501DRAFT_233519 [Backusella circina FSU 941]|nr:hypothetical protein K501DRAFT_233519 [Backusella circina FSU 941]